MEEISNTLVSVIIPLYNCSDYIEECLDSVLNQKCSSIEVIVVDDGSTDDGFKKVERYAGVKLIRQSNQGVTAARKTGVNASRGEWIMFVDADDTVSEDIISSWIPLMSADTNMIIGKMPEDKVVSPEQLIYDLLEMRRFPTVPWLKLFRRSLFESIDALEFPREIVWGEDVLMLFRLALSAKGKVVYSKKRNYRYRRHPGQVTRTFRVTSEYESRYYSLMLRLVPSGRMNDRLRRALIWFRLVLFERILKDMRFSGDDVRASQWYADLLRDMDQSGYRPSLWFRVLMRYGNADNYSRLHSIKWLFKSLNAFK